MSELEGGRSAQGPEPLLDPELKHQTLIHDFNNVFETITEAAELLNSDKRWRPLAATLIRSVARGQRLLGAIPDRRAVLLAIVDDAMQSMADYCTAARKPRLQVVRQIAPDISLPGSAKDWERVFANLFLNSIQVLRRPGRVEVSAALGGELLLITVSDNGPGIPEQILPILFHPDVSTKEAAQTRGKRSGMGLHIVATIVESYGGRVSAANKDAQSGAVFTIQVPAHR